MKKFTINGKKYDAKPLTFDALCELEDLGFQIEELFEKQMKGFRAYLAYCGNMDIRQAGAELEAHLANGGTFVELSDVLLNEVKESCFFRAFMANTEESNQESQGEEKPEEK